LGSSQVKQLYIFRVVLCLQQSCALINAECYFLGLVQIFVVKVKIFLHRPNQLGELALDVLLNGPEALVENCEHTIHTLKFIGLPDMIRILPHEVITEVKVFHHTFNFLDECVAALSFKFDDHGFLRFKRSRLVHQKSSAQCSLIKFLERVFGLANFEENQDLINNLYKVVI
jgi:hypothetical protein